MYNFMKAIYQQRKLFSILSGHRHNRRTKEEVCYAVHNILIQNKTMDVCFLHNMICSYNIYNHSCVLQWDIEPSRMEPDILNKVINEFTL